MKNVSQLFFNGSFCELFLLSLKLLEFYKVALDVEVIIDQFYH